MNTSQPEHASCNFESHYGTARLHIYAFGEHEEDNLLCIDARKPDDKDAPLVRVQSACYTAEIFRSTDCDCHEQLDTSLTLIHAVGGLLVYMICDGRGAGLLTKVRGLALGDTAGLDTFDAYQQLGVSPDPRNYERVAHVLRSLGATEVQLLTNNPRKIDGLEAAGISVSRVPLEIQPTEGSRAYLRTKQLKFGHLLNIDDAS
jgi:GTP cyclohydrolase II